MFIAEDIITFLIATVILNLTPGNDVIFVGTQSMNGGLRNGITAALGISVGCLFHICLVSFGVAELLSLYPIAFTSVKILGAGYLLYLAYQSFRSSGLTIKEEKEGSSKMHNSFFKGVLTNILNPKVAIFFLAFLPQFIHIERGSIALQAFLFGGIFICSATLINSGYAVLFSKIHRYLQNSRVFQRYLSKLTAGVFGLLAFKLILSERNS